MQQLPPLPAVEAQSFKNLGRALEFLSKDASLLTKAANKSAWYKAAASILKSAPYVSPSFLLPVILPSSFRKQMNNLGKTKAIKG